MSRKVLKELQDSLMIKGTNPSKMSIVPDDEVKKLNIPVDEKDQSKENVGSVRRSKRKNAGSEIKEKKTSKEVAKKMKPKKVTARKSKAQLKKVSCEASPSSNVVFEVKDENAMENYISNGISETKIDSGLRASSSSVQNSSVTSEELTVNFMHSVLLNKSVTDDISLMTSTKPTEKYWEILAEERRIILEKILYENELLQDQIHVLETDSIRLREAVDAAEKVLKAVGLLD